MSTPSIIPQEKSGNVIIQIQYKRNRTNGVMFANNERVKIQENGATTIDLAYAEIKRIRILADGILIYPKHQRGWIGVYYELVEGAHEENGKNILEWKAIFKQAPVESQTSSLVMAVCFSIVFFIVFVFFLKWFVFPALAVLLFVYYKFINK